MSAASGPAGPPPGPPGADPDDEAAAIALAGLPGIGPVSLGRLLAGTGGPAAAWEAVRAGRACRPGPPAPGGVPWAVAARRVDPAARRAAAVAAGIRTTWLGRPEYPARLAADPLPPPVLFWRGELTALERRCVAVVGTRRCTPAGSRLAWELGRDLAAAGVCIVSGLALGIDGHAHLGACAAGGPGGTVGVAASGVDVAYPRRHAGLWERVVTAGAVLSETAPGGAAQRWRFPARNRVIAGLADLVVVVESHEGGGSQLTVDAALQRGVEVRAVPGPVHSSASAGTNQLLVDGAGPVRSAEDVLDALGELRPPPAGRRPGGGGPGARPGPPARAAAPPGVADPVLRAVLDAVGWVPTSLNGVVAAAGLPVGAVGAALDQLVRTGAIAEERGWWQRVR